MENSKDCNLSLIAINIFLQTIKFKINNIKGEKGRSWDGFSKTWYNGRRSMFEIGQNVRVSYGEAKKKGCKLLNLENQGEGMENNLNLNFKGWK